MREVHAFDYMPWGCRKTKENIMGELGCKKPAGHVSTWTTDRKLTLIVDYCLLKMHGCSEVYFGYCKMISSGVMNREEVLEQEQM